MPDSSSNLSTRIWFYQILTKTQFFHTVFHIDEGIPFALSAFRGRPPQYERRHKTRRKSHSIKEKEQSAENITTHRRPHVTPSMSAVFQISLQSQNKIHTLSIIYISDLTLATCVAMGIPNWILYFWLDIIVVFAGLPLAGLESWLDGQAGRYEFLQWWELRCVNLIVKIEYYMWKLLSD